MKVLKLHIAYLSNLYKSKIQRLYGLKVILVKQIKKLIRQSPEKIQRLEKKWRKDESCLIAVSGEITWGPYPPYAQVDQPYVLVSKRWTKPTSKCIDKRAAHKSRAVMNCSFSLLLCLGILIHTGFLWTHSYMENTDIVTKRVTTKPEFWRDKRRKREQGVY